jgi:hypothetical protein
VCVDVCPWRYSGGASCPRNTVSGRKYSTHSRLQSRAKGLEPSTFGSTVRIDPPVKHKILKNLHYFIIVAIVRIVVIVAIGGKMVARQSVVHCAHGCRSIYATRQTQRTRITLRFTAEWIFCCANTRGDIGRLFRCVPTRHNGRASIAGGCCERSGWHCQAMGIG